MITSGITSHIAGTLQNLEVDTTLEQIIHFISSNKDSTGHLTFNYDLKNILKT